MQRKPITWGYCRISTPYQSIYRQEHNILQVFPDAIIVKEVYTGSTMDREELKKIIKKCLPGDRIAFDEVSRLSRESAGGFALWKQLFDQGIDLVFLKQPHINTSVYREVLQNTIPLVGDDIDLILEGVNKYLMRLAEKQIKLAFEQAEKELELLHFMASNPNKVFTREQLMYEVWGYDYPGDSRTVDVHIKRLREKVKGGDNWELQTVWGVGYKFEVK